MLFVLQYLHKCSWKSAWQSAINRSISNFVKVVEVGPRDGLQNEQQLVPTSTKIDFVNKLTSCHFKNIEVTSFVSPKWVPQMKDHTEVMMGIDKNFNTTYSALTPNLTGFQKAVEAGVDEIAVFGSASESFSKKNINCSIVESLERFKPVVEAAQRQGFPVRGYVSCCIGCPYEGNIAPKAVVQVAEKMFDMGCYEISLGDTIGVGTPGTIKTLLLNVVQATDPSKVALHCHDTYGQALANILVGLDAGIKTIDASVAGLGGCPYAKGASGNVATEDVVYMLHGMGVQTGINLEKLVDIGCYISTYLGRPNHSKVGTALSATQ